LLRVSSSSRSVSVSSNLGAGRAMPLFYTLEGSVTQFRLMVLGRYHFELDDLAKDGHLRPLRDPESLDTFELTWEN
jgi:hypothetical protein